MQEVDLNSSSSSSSEEEEEEESRQGATAARPSSSRGMTEGDFMFSVKSKKSV